MIADVRSADSHGGYGHGTRQDALSIPGRPEVREGQGPNVKGAGPACTQLVSRQASATEDAIAVTIISILTPGDISSFTTTVARHG